MTPKAKNRLIMFLASLLFLGASIWYVTAFETPGAVLPGEDAAETYEDLVAENAQYIEEGVLESIELEEPYSTAAKYEDTGIAGLAPKDPNMFDVMAEADQWRSSRPITLKSETVIPVQANTELVEVSGDIILPSAQENLDEMAQTRSVSMLTAPVDYRIIKTDAQYTAFKKTATGVYPRVDFTKNYFLILESKSNLPDNIFQLVEVKKDGKKTVANFRVNIFGLDKRTHSHTYKIIDNKTQEVTLEQVL